MNSVRSSSVLGVFGRNASDKLKCITACTFVALSDGIIISWFAVAGEKFNESDWIGGDNEAFDGRGLGTLLLGIMWQIALIFIKSTFQLSE